VAVRPGAMHARRRRVTNELSYVLNNLRYASPAVLSRSSRRSNKRFNSVQHYAATATHGRWSAVRRHGDKVKRSTAGQIS